MWVENEKQKLKSSPAANKTHFTLAGTMECHSWKKARPNRSKEALEPAAEPERDSHSPLC